MTNTLHHRSILLIISGGIAAYKSLELIRRLKDNGAQVRCILTEGGAQFITPLSVAALSGEPTLTKLFDANDEQQFGHIRLSREADLVVVAPASANMIAKMAHGLADNLASAILLATNKPVMIAPAMNSMMWQHPATQANIATLSARGILQVGPASGNLACGEEGAGRMSEPDAILSAIFDHFGASGALKGKRALVTSGPTYEPIDPVRFIGNRSSGKQGHAIAAALAAQGAEVTLVTGPTTLPDQQGVCTIHIETAREMLAVCEAALPYDIAVCAAAVADWRAENESNQKIKKGEDAPTLSLTENPDILAALAQHKTSRPKLVIGFAAETDNVIENAEAKFTRKGCDWILANQVGNGMGFGSDDNSVTLLRRDANGIITAEPWPTASKFDIAQRLGLEIAKAV
ncbi:MAG TPA: bifunctional phosphopantothenoylcysteine decarboxylase/phosphopantothenate--cysteine ligase CoaBC [Rhodospirillaceae bacterium]|nr:bifunctional phosphopantothenoylcysteine decarboxylase/phosphopantothenate--cysteine ligase CoaBC [Rhodospirillaceae bacterium]